jgi:hypothetical protein
VATAQRGLQLGAFLADLIEHTLSIFPIESNVRRAPRQLCRFQHARQASWNAVQQRCRLRSLPAALRAFAFIPAGFSLLCFQLFPIAQNVGGCARLTGPENMRMAAHHLIVNIFDYVANIELPRFLRHQRMKNNLQQQVTQFAGKLPRVVIFQRVQNLVGFFHQKRSQAPWRLLAIPGTPVRRAQTCLQRHQLLEKQSGSALFSNSALRPRLVPWLRVRCPFCLRQWILFLR